jgi:hypothetical protein
LNSVNHDDNHYAVFWSSFSPFSLRPKDFLNTLFSTTLSLFLPLYEKPNVTPVLNSGQNYSFVFFNQYVLDRKREDKRFWTIR